MLCTDRSCSASGNVAAGLPKLDFRRPRKPAVLKPMPSWFALTGLFVNRVDAACPYAALGRPFYGGCRGEPSR